MVAFLSSVKECFISSERSKFEEDNCLITCSKKMYLLTYVSTFHWKRILYFKLFLLVDDVENKCLLIQYFDKQNISNEKNLHWSSRGSSKK